MRNENVSAGWRNSRNMMNQGDVYRRNTENRTTICRQGDSYRSPYLRENSDPMRRTQLQRGYQRHDTQETRQLRGDTNNNSASRASYADRYDRNRAAGNKFTRTGSLNVIEEMEEQMDSRNGKD